MTCQAKPSPYGCRIATHTYFPIIMGDIKKNKKIKKDVILVPVPSVPDADVKILGWKPITDKCIMVQMFNLN